MPSRFAFFDLGNVLVHFEHERAVQQLAALCNAGHDQVRNAVFGSGLQEQFETGLIDAPDYCGQVNHALGTQVPDSDILEAISAIFTFNEPILEALEFLHSVHVPMGILSNTCSAHWNWILNKHWPVPGNRFQFEVLSYEVQAMKPDEKIYAASETRAGLRGRPIFFTDDRPENIAAAQQRGWTAHLYTGVEPLLDALQAWTDVTP